MVKLKKIQQINLQSSIGLGIIIKITNKTNINNNFLILFIGQITNSKANPEIAKKISNEILNMASISQTNTKFQCLPISNSNSPINYTCNFKYCKVY